ncbi:Atypical kinase COQ8B, mitochondrial [Lamellibrachia satsuma]|nr:Atypical kinase COQ8B, mitochondrial [Lamellibrachia satsuma]
MPTWQMERVITTELGPDWKDQLQTFDDKPFAAASIGQVHRGVLQDGRPVAMKIQYPGVASSIDSDINNLMTVLNVWKILPDGLYAEKAMEVARKELRYECDYDREARASTRFRELMKDDPVFYVPEVIDSLSRKQVLTTELVSGVSLDKVVSMDQETRSWVCENMMRLCLQELFVFHIMQTDPNWSNFLYDAETERISLLDFGATRAYSRRFTDDYIRVIMAASTGDRQTVLDGSRKLGFLTGFESKVMEKAHIDAVMILGEPFASDKPFNFGNQTTAKRIQELIPVLLKHRLVPPPEESYSLHRKLSGAFLLSTKLGAIMSMKNLFYDIYDNFEFGREDDPTPF